MSVPPGEVVAAEATKACCADLYASEWARVLLGDSFHPGGLALTERLGHLLRLSADSRVLDLAAGGGTSALHLARTFGCHVVGLDYSDDNVARARQAAQDAGLSDRVAFFQADAEQLSPVADEAFTAVLCECAYCTFPNKHAAAAEIFRVLAPGGHFGLSDLTRKTTLPPELDGLLAWIACIADALPIKTYVSQFTTAGLHVQHIEEHDAALAELVHQIRGRLVGADLVAKLQHLDMPQAALDFQQAKALARRAADAVRAGVLGYTLIIASKPRSGCGHLVERAS